MDIRYISKVEDREKYCQTKCPDWILQGVWNVYCSPQCAENEFTDEWGKCHSCEETTSVSIFAVPDSGCETCPRRLQSGSVCILKCGDNQFRGGNGVCYSCYEENPIDTNAGGRSAGSYCTDVCPNRILNGYNNSKCARAFCGAGMFTGNDGKCYACHEEKNIDVLGVTHEGCEQCPDTRNLYNNRFCVPKCSGDMPLRGSDNKCYPCDTETRVPVSSMTDACYECADQRKLDGNYCVLK